MNRKGLFTPEQENFLIEMIFFFAVFKNKFLKWAAKPIISMIIRGIDDFIFNRIRPDWKADIIPILDKAIQGQYNETRQLVTDWINKTYTIKHVNRDLQLEFFDSITRTIASGTVVLLEYREGIRNEKAAA